MASWALLALRRPPTAGLPTFRPSRDAHAVGAAARTAGKHASRRPYAAGGRTVREGWTRGRYVEVLQVARQPDGDGVIGT